MTPHEGRNWVEHPLALIFFSAALTGIVTGLINWGSMNTAVKNNKENIDRSAQQWREALEAERRVNEAWRVGLQNEQQQISARLTRLEDKRADSGQAGLFQLAHYSVLVADAVIPQVPPVIVPSKPQVLEDEIEELDEEIKRIENGKKFSELNDLEQDELRGLRVRRDIARIWQAWCANDESRFSYCVDRFGEP